MPLAHGNAEAADITTSFNENSVGQLSLVVIIEPLHFAAKRYNGLGGVTMAMDGHHRARLQGVEHTLALVGGGVARRGCCAGRGSSADAGRPWLERSVRQGDVY